MNIISIPNPILRTKSLSVEKVDKKLLQFIAEMEDTLDKKRNPEGVGLSAPQVGQNIRVFSTRFKNSDGEKVLRSYINPTLIKVSQEMTLGPNPDKPFLEGCLSIPKLYGPVYRHYWVRLEYYTIDPNTLSLVKQHKRFESFPARVIQHEYDHLEGVLFTDRTVADNLPIYEENGDDLVEIDALQIPKT